MTTTANSEPVYIKIVSGSFEETSRLAQLTSQATGLKLSGMRPSHDNEFVCFLTSSGDDRDGDNNN